MTARPIRAVFGKNLGERDQTVNQSGVNKLAKKFAYHIRTKFDQQF